MVRLNLPLALVTLAVASSALPTQQNTQNSNSAANQPADGTASDATKVLI